MPRKPRSRTPRRAIRDAQLDLEYCRVTAPFTGRIGARQVSIGSLVAGSRAATSPTTLLATLVSLDPIYLDFDMSESDYLTFSRERARLPGPLANKVVIGLSDENRFTRARHARLRRQRARPLERHDPCARHGAKSRPVPGAGPVRPASRCDRPAGAGLLLPDAAVVLDQSQHLVMTVAADGTVVPKIVETGDLRGGLRVIRSGLEPERPRRHRRAGARRSRHQSRAPGRRHPLRRRRRRPRLRQEPCTVRLTHFFIDRPIFATVLCVFVTLIGLGALAILPVAQYPEIVPPTVQITTTYPGASAETVSRTVATPLEQQINGVENMLYMNSQSTGDGKLTVTVTFRIGTDLNVAQMLTQNRVQDALPRLPEDVQRLGVQVRKSTPNILLAVHLYSPDSSRDTLYLSNYATLHVKDVLARLPGVGDVSSWAPANMPCASGSIRTRSQPITSTPAKCLPPCGRRTSRSRRAS